MKKLLNAFALLLSAGFLYGCQDSESDGIKVAVSIVPQAAFVEEIGGDLVDVTTVIPVGFSPASYQPSARQIVDINNAEIYFTIGVAAEDGNIIPELNDLYMVHLEDYVSEAYNDIYFDEEDHDHEEDHETTTEDHDHETTTEDDHDDHAHFGRDPHIWLSLKRVKVMVDVIADELSKLDPDNASVYKANANDFKADIDALDADIEAMFANKTMRTFIIYHPSLGYFAEDYNLEMKALEEDGKEPSIAHLQELIDFARDNNIDRIFKQAEIDSDQVTTFKNDINGESIQLFPLAFDYLDNYRSMAEAISQGMS